MTKNPKDIILGTPQPCPKCGFSNPSGFNLPKDCIWCKHLSKEMDDQAKNIKQLSIEEFNNNFLNINSKEEMIDINNIVKSLIQIRNEKVQYFDPTKQHFNIGDIAYIYDGYLIHEVRITGIQSFKKEPNDNGYIYYFYEDIDITSFDRIKMYLKYYFHIYFLQYIFPTKPYFPPDKFGSGHGELVGRGEFLFKDKKQAELDYALHTCIETLKELNF